MIADGWYPEPSNTVPTWILPLLIDECTEHIRRGEFAEAESRLVYDLNLSDEMANYIFDEGKRRAILLERTDEVLQDAIATLRANGFDIVPSPELAAKIEEATGKKLEDLGEIGFKVK